MKELQRILSSMEPDGPVRILVDNSIAYFQMEGIEFSARRIESSFPDYEKILNPQNTTTMRLKRADLVSALERVDVVVKDSSRMVIMKLSPEGDLHLSGRAPELGEVKEVLDSTIDGEPLLIAFNVSYLADGLKAFKGEEVYMTFNGPEGQMTMLRPEMDDFLYMLMPIKISEAEAGSDSDLDEEE
jgi:DNA polymerase-3 subunit beta